MSAGGTTAPGAGQLEDATIGFRSFGQPVAGRSPVVVLPGLGVSSYLRTACAELAQTWQRHVVLVDPPGFGTSARALPVPASFGVVTERLRPWLEQWGRVLLVGQSTGCLLAAALAAHDDEKPDTAPHALALVGPVFDPRRSTLRRAALGLVRDGAGEPWWLGPLEAPEWVRNARSLPGYLRSCLEVDLADQLDRVTCDVVLVRGDRDPLARHEWVAGLADNPRRTLVTVPGGAHTFMADYPAMLGASLTLGDLGPDAQDRT